MTNRDLVFLDTETLGIALDAPIWEIAAIRRDGTTCEETELYLQVEHHPAGWLDDLDEPFLTDYRDRFIPDLAVSRYESALAVYQFTEGAYIVGVVPNFDTERIAHQLLRPALLPPEPWRYHLTDVGSLVTGYLAAHGELPAGPWTSDALSAAVGVDPADYRRHTAMDDVRWAAAQHDIVMGFTRDGEQ